MARHKDVDWSIGKNGAEGLTWEQVQVAVLMDIRDELKRLNNVFNCPNALQIPDILRAIRKNTTRKKRTKKVPS